MCGIAGYVVRDGSADPGVLDRQLRLLLHRGPDSMGSFGDGCGIVGQSRLSVIDLETGDPPITDEHDRVGVALNGEVYNFAEIRDELRRRGHDFSSHGDTEVIAHLAEDADPVGLARRLDGMFAFAVWDRRRRRLVLGRDRLGKKPLYYVATPRAFVFASEIKALLVHPEVTTELDPSAIPAYLTFGYVPTPRTFFKGVQSLPPGHVLTVDADLHVQLEAYWEPQVRGPGLPPSDLSEDETATEVRRLLSAAVRRRLVSDVPIGAFLSGGVDSSAVVATMAELLDRPVRTFTIGFEDTAGYDERRYAALVAQRFGTEHTEFVVQPNAVDLVERLVYHHDQPFGDSSAIPTFLLSELTRQHVTVALSGDGGDELFAGYERFAAGLALGPVQRLPRPVLAGASRLSGVLAPRARLAGKAQRFLERATLPMPDAYRGWISYVPDDLVRELVGELSPWATGDYRSLWGASQGSDPLDRLLLLNLRTYLLDDLLVKVDRMSMAHGLEVRSPLLDTALVEFALRLPRHQRIRGLTLKRALKRAMAADLPPEILRRPKRGFGVPLDRWFRQDLVGYVEARLCASGAPIARYVDAERLRALVASHGAGRDLGATLWTLLTLDVFLERMGW